MEPLFRVRTKVQRAMSTAASREDVWTHQRLEMGSRVRSQAQRAIRKEVAGDSADARRCGARPKSPRTCRRERLAQDERELARLGGGRRTEAWGRSQRNVSTEMGLTLKGRRGATDTEALSKDSSRIHQETIADCRRKRGQTPPASRPRQPRAASQSITRQETETQPVDSPKGPERDLQRDRARTSSLDTPIGPHVPPHTPSRTPPHPSTAQAALWRLREGVRLELEGLLQVEESQVRAWAQNAMSSVQLDCLELYDEVLAEFGSEGSGTGIMKQEDYEEAKETLKSYFENMKARCDFSEVDECFRQAAAELDLILQKYLGDAVAESPQPRRRTVQLGEPVKETKLSTPPSPGPWRPWALPPQSSVTLLSSENPLTVACHPRPEEPPPLRNLGVPETQRQPPQPGRHIIQVDEAFEENQLSTPPSPGPRGPWALPPQSPVTPLSSLNSLPTAPHRSLEEPSPSRNARAPEIQKQCPGAKRRAFQVDPEKDEEDNVSTSSNPDADLPQVTAPLSSELPVPRPLPCLPPITSQEKAGVKKTKRKRKKRQEKQESQEGPSPGDKPPELLKVRTHLEDPVAPKTLGEVSSSRSFTRMLCCSGVDGDESDSTELKRRHGSLNTQEQDEERRQKWEGRLMEQRREAQEEKERRKLEEERRKVQEMRRKVFEKQQRRQAKEEEARRKVLEEEKRRREKEEEQRRKTEEKQRRRRTKAANAMRRTVDKEERRRAREAEENRREQQKQEVRQEKKEQRSWKAFARGMEKRLQQEEERRQKEREAWRRAQEEERRNWLKEENKKRAEEEKERRRVWEEEERKQAKEERERMKLLEKQKKKEAKEEKERRRVCKKEKKKQLKEEEERRRVSEKQQLKEKMERRRVLEKEEEKRRRILEKEKKEQMKQEEERRKIMEKEEKKQRKQEEERRKITEKEEMKRRRVLEKEEGKRRKIAEKEEMKRRRVLEKEEKRRKILEKEEKEQLKQEQKRRKIVEKEEMKRRKSLEKEEEKRRKILRQEEKEQMKQAVEKRRREVEKEKKRETKAQRKRVKEEESSL